MLSAAPDPIGLLRAYQRRWLLATGLGMLVAILVMVGAWFVIPQTGDVVQYMRVARNTESVIGAGRETGAAEFEVFKNTTIQLIKSRMSLTAGRQWITSPMEEVLTSSSFTRRRFPPWDRPGETS